MLNKRNRRRTIRNSFLGLNLVLLLAVGGFVFGYKPQPNVPISAQSVIGEANQALSPLDEISSADIAVNVAKAVELPEATSVTNLADSLNAQLTVASDNNSVVTKPQVISTGLKSRKDIQIYKAVEGDTIESVATKFEVTSDTIKWSNDIPRNNITPGQELVISPVNGIVYKVKQGDTLDTIIAKFQANRQQFISFNDLESGEVPVNQYVVIPGGQPQAAPVRASFRGEQTAVGFSATYGGQGYSFGYCTYYAAVRRAQIGRPIPTNLGNASTWLMRARAAGYATGNQPANGAVIWTPPRNFYGHVGFVEEVFADGRVRISEMNVAGWNRVSTSILSPEEAARYSYIY
jgi:N-acetylmuramoyl-L-alanine amidase